MPIPNAELDPFGDADEEPNGELDCGTLLPGALPNPGVDLPGDQAPGIPVEEAEDIPSGEFDCGMLPPGESPRPLGTDDEPKGELPDPCF